jgi:ABC-type nickel/cobalt efflux system permease component RcnA
MNIEIWSLLFLAFGLGMLHALDADHIMAVSSLSCQKPDRKKSLLFCSRWALGHGAAVMVIGVAVIFLGVAIPEELSATAESLVGLVLIALGAYVLWDMLRKRAHLHFHRHDGMHAHAHWHSHQQAQSTHQADPHKHSHAPVFVGLLHGTAGSAPLLALLPLSQMTSPWSGFAYLLLFGIGVFISMLLFGGLLGQVFTWLKQWGNQFINALRILVSVVSMGYGASLMMGHF